MLEKVDPRQGFRRCHKVQHDTKDAAYSNLRLAKVRGLVSGTTEVYSCPVCHHWHWGHSPGKNRRTKVRWR